MKKYPFLLIFYLMLANGGLQAQSNCHCQHALAYDQPILSAYQDSPDAAAQSFTKIKHHLDSKMNLDSISDRMHNRAYIHVNNTGSVCYISYEFPISPKGAAYIKRIISSLKFANTCFKFTISMNVSEWLVTTEPVVILTDTLPVIQGCQSTDKYKSRYCMEKKIHQLIYSHPLYKSLKYDGKLKSIEFVVTTSGKTLFYKNKEGETDLEIIQKIIADTKWLPAKTKKGEAIAFRYSLDLLKQW